MIAKSTRNNKDRNSTSGYNHGVIVIRVMIVIVMAVVVLGMGGGRGNGPEARVAGVRGGGW